MELKDYEGSNFKENQTGKIRSSLGIYSDHQRIFWTIRGRNLNWELTPMYKMLFDKKEDFFDSIYKKRSGSENETQTNFKY